MIESKKENLAFEESVFVDKNKIKKVYIVGGILLLVAIACIIWAVINWDDYTHVTQNALTGRVRTKGLAAYLYGWGWGFAICIPIVYGTMWFTLDFKNPSLAVCKEGLYINKDFMKKTLISWDEFSTINEKQDGGIELLLKNPTKLVESQSGLGKAFLKQTYITQKSPIVVKKEEKKISNYLKKHITT